MTFFPICDINDISLPKARLLGLVALTLAALLTGMVSAVTAPSPEAQEIANFLMIASVTAIICSLFGIKQSNDHCRSVQYGLSAFEAMKKDLKGVESELEETRGRLHEVENELAQTQEWLYESDSDLYEAWDNLASAESKLGEAKLKLRRKEEDAELAEHCYESLRKTCSETTLDLLKTKRERDNLRCELVLARKVIRKLIAGRNKLRYELTEAKIGFEWFLSLYYEAEERIRFAKQQIERLEQQIEHLETVNKLLAKFATDDV